MSEAIKTERLELRRWSDEDAGALVPLIDNLKVSRWLTRVPYPYTIEDARDFISRHRDQGAGDVFAVLHEGAIIGCCSVGGELGYWLGEPYWGKGYATEAARVLVARHFTRTDAPLDSGYFSANAASKSVLTKLGFEPTRTETAICLASGEDVTIQKVTLTNSCWSALQ